MDKILDKIPVTKKKNVNTFGSFDLEDRGWEETYVCHMRLYTKTIHKYVWTSCVYVPSTQIPFEVQSAYFDWILSPEYSPWRDLLNSVDFYIKRGKDGCPLAVAIDTEDVPFESKVIMHFLKAFRHIFESGNVQYWHEFYCKYGPDHKKTNEAFVVSNFMLNTNKNQQVRFYIGGDHRLIKTTINENFLNKVLEKSDKTYHKMEGVSTETRLLSAFGDTEVFDFQRKPKSIEKILEKQDLEGYFTTTFINGGKYFDIKDVKKNQSKIIEELKNAA